MSPDILTLSASRIKTFASCPRKFYYHYIEEHPDPMHPAAAMGSAVHKTIEQVYKQGVEPFNTFQENWIAQMKEYPELTTHPKTNAAQQDGVKIITKYDFERRVPQELELEFRLPFPDPIDPVCYMRGFIDHIYEDGTLVDLKTSRNRPKPAILGFDPQFIIYEWAFLNIYGELPRHVYWHHLRTGEDIEAIVRGHGQLDHVRRLVDKIARMYRTMERRKSALEERGKTDDGVIHLFDRNAGEPCLFCSYRTPCLGEQEAH
jgi:hypothetical protein